MLSGARCEKCNHALPLRGEPFSFHLPPDSVVCPGCGHECPTILPYRVGWMESLLWKVLAALSLPLCAAAAWLGDWDPTVRVLILIAGPPVGGGLGGLILSRLLAFPLTVLRDARRGR